MQTCVVGRVALGARAVVCLGPGRTEAEPLAELTSSSSGLRPLALCGYDAGQVISDHVEHTGAASALGELSQRVQLST